ncbi:multidrug DMT transporter permease [Azospirillum sp. TSH100]|uniref:DMT family transporter n=1 Tax=Azospirillum sp. TSH100 TaxID=652764 RepID=UPI000D6202A7|nr:DMT family transporter [Azospirillum sp. TSH100]PWC83409.1 multidrug DMT transporter permease [Azospirillum sp. TSH100]QCG87331.1 DMT family transporter [Azospirillum sp. TSH100]
MPAGRTATVKGSRLADQAWLLMMLPPLFWAGNAVLGRAVAGTVPPIGLAFWRWCLGMLIVLPFAWPHLRHDITPILARWKSVLLLGTLGIGIYNTFQYIALTTTTALNCVMLQSSMPVMIVLMSLVLFRDRIGAMQGVGIAVSLAGAMTLISHGDPGTLLGLELNAGDVWMLAAVVIYAAYTTLLRRRPAIHGLSFVVVTFAIGAVELLPFYLWESLSGHPVRASGITLLAVGYTVLFPSIAAYLCFNRAVELLGPNTAGLAIHLVPVFGSLLAILFLGEQPHLYHGIGIALIAAGIVLATRRRA